MVMQISERCSQGTLHQLNRSYCTSALPLLMHTISHRKLLPP